MIGRTFSYCIATIAACIILPSAAVFALVRTSWEMSEILTDDVLKFLARYHKS